MTILIAALALALAACGGDSGGSGGDGAEAEPIDGVETFVIGQVAHVEGTVDYGQSPPVGGDHNAVWINCGYYSAEIPNENAVHALEHGAVWITYSPGIDSNTLDALQARIKGESHLLVSAYTDQTSPLVLSAWGAQLAVDDVNDERVESFITQYESSSQAPEPGAACHSGVGEPTVSP